MTGGCYHQEKDLARFDLPGAEARSTTVKVNRSVARKLGISLENIDRLYPPK